MGKIVVAAVLVSLVAARTAAAEPASTPDPFPVVNGSVRAIAVNGDTAYLGGNFTQIGPGTGPMALLSVAGGVDRTFRGIASRRDLGSDPIPAVWALESDGAGGWYAGGEFQRVDGHYRHGLVHFLADGRVDPAFRLDTDGEVKALALDRATGTLWIGGEFERIDGEWRPSLVAVDAATGGLRPWSPKGPSREVVDIEIDGERVFVGGWFSSIDEETRVGAAAYARQTGELLDWNPRLRNASVADIDVHDGVVYLVGEFHEVGGYELSGAAAVRATDASVLPVDFGVGGVQSVLATDDVVIMGGVGGSREGARDGLAAFDPETGALLPWFADVAADLDGPYTLEAAGSTVYVDSIERVGDEPRDGLAAFDLETGEFLPWAPPGPDAMVLDIEAAGGQVAIGGRFTMLGGVVRRDLAAVDLRTNTVTAFDAQIAPKLVCCSGDESRVNALALVDGTLWVGGNFNRVGAEDRQNLARLDPVTGAPGPAPPAPNWEVGAFEHAYGRLYLSGGFSKVGEHDRRRVAALDLPAGTVSGFTATFDCGVHAFGPFAAGELLAGGCFQGGLRSLDAATGATRSATPAADSWVETIEPDGEGGAWVGGQFRSFGGPGGPPGLVRLRPDGSLDPRVPAVELEDDVLEVTAAGGGAYVGGWFDRVGGEARGGVTTMRAADGAVGRWDPRPHGVAFEFAPLPGGGVLMGGSFDTLELRAGQGVARFGPAQAGAPPQLLIPPRVEGDRYVDGGQRVVAGDFSGAPSRRELRWLRCDAAGENCVDTGHRSRFNAVRSGDVGHRFRVEVVAENDSGASAPVRSAPGPLMAGELPDGGGTPQVTGEEREGSTLTIVTHGTWTGEPTSFSYQWRRCRYDGCEWIDGAEGRSYTLTGRDLWADVNAVVWGHNAAGRGAGISSVIFGPVQPAGSAGVPQNTRRPAILGAIRNPTTLFADLGDWNRNPSGVGVQWQRCAADGGSCEVIGHRGWAYEIGPEHAGLRFRIGASAANDRGTAEFIYSELTPVIPGPAEPAPTATPTPTPTSEDEAPPEVVDEGGTTTTNELVALPGWLEAPAVRVHSARAVAGRRVVLRLATTAPVHARVELRRSGRAIARGSRNLVGDARIRLRLDRDAWRTLQRRSRLAVTVVVSAAGATHRSRQVLRR